MQDEDVFKTNKMPNTFELMASLPPCKRQASVFQDHRGNHITDPSDEEAYWWVTVTLPDHILEGTQTDEQIMHRVYKTISIEKKTGLRNIEIGHLLTPQEIMIQAEILAFWWLEQIQKPRIFLDQFMIFTAKGGFHGDCLDLPLDWGKPSFAGPY
ncbi:uncharacterized protein N7506_003616 [Penicillium brevicompactum]|uniref:uncharacterized protein n=1 Tax=Penicillium brevicompactum TaxID=5074 RepID=UPI002540FB8E|nr:uncharacterized protein N7506_003616 [Penicillium brevicompactum]KAJ5343792.1 hypothetical protein N7506_003616 [Penicillium brevicompactum]